MAKQNETQVQSDAEEQGGGKKPKGKLLVVAAGLAMLAVGGATGWLLRGKGHDAAEPAAAAAAVVAPSGPPVYVTLDPFVVNLAGESERYAQVAIDLKVADRRVPDMIKERMPEIRNGILLLLSSKQAEELATLTGKNQLRQDIRATVNAALGLGAPAASSDGEAHAGEPAAAGDAGGGALDVLLTSFVIQ